MPRRKRKLTPEEIERQEAEPMPPREAMSVMDVGAAVIGTPPGPVIAEAVPDEAAADEAAPIYRTQ